MHPPFLHIEHGIKSSKFIAFARPKPYRSSGERRLQRRLLVALGRRQNDILEHICSRIEVFGLIVVAIPLPDPQQ